MIFSIPVTDIQLLHKILQKIVLSKIYVSIWYTYPQSWIPTL